ncbi:hypothetical protein ANAPRD1_01180 [Anaplasma phagocytophilum]|nr:hypothetical protein ANAPC5_01316 [Anaplasma phagocytophilum]SCV66637.1 hypothetical protein ANAPRD1_01180 [Anaplasma phagocytophilum]
MGNGNAARCCFRRGLVFCEPEHTERSEAQHNIDLMKSFGFRDSEGRVDFKRLPSKD